MRLRLPILQSLLAVTTASTAVAQSPAGYTFTYQGYLRQADQPVNGSKCFEFRLFDSPTTGSQIGDTVQMCEVTVDEGRFYTDLNFGETAFASQARWLEIAVAPDDGSQYTILSPRQRINPAPQSMHSANADYATTASNGIQPGYTILTSSATPPPGFEWTGELLESKSADGQWKNAANLPNNHVEFSGGVINDRIYIATRNTAAEYNPLSDTWTAKSPMPTFRYDSAGAVINGKLYVAGGQTGSEATAVTEVYTPSTNSWQTVAPMPEPVLRHAATECNGKLYSIGGDAGPVTGRTDVLEYNPIDNQWSTKAPMPVGRRHPGVVSLNNKVHVIGGYSGTAGVQSRHDVYDPSTNSWSTAAPLPEALTRVSAAVLHGKIYIAGGEGQINALSDALYVYDPDTNSWTPATPLPAAHCAGFVAAIGPRVYIAGGLINDDVHVEPTDQTFVYESRPGSSYYLHVKQ